VNLFHWAVFWSVDGSPDQLYVDYHAALTPWRARKLVRAELAAKYGTTALDIITIRNTELRRGAA
jgi:hypothetical protein